MVAQGRDGVAALDLVPKTPALGPVDYTPMLVAYVCATAVVALVGRSLSVVAFGQDVSHVISEQLQPLTPIVGGATIFLMSVFAVRRLPRPTGVTGLRASLFISVSR